MQWLVSYHELLEGNEVIWAPGSLLSAFVCVFLSQIGFILYILVLGLKHLLVFKRRRHFKAFYETYQRTHQWQCHRHRHLYSPWKERNGEKMVETFFRKFTTSFLISSSRFVLPSFALSKKAEYESISGLTPL